MIKFPHIKTQRLAIKLKATAEKLVKQGHPWIFEDSIAKQNKDGNTGDIAILFDQRKDKVFAIGLYDPDSPIRIKVISPVPATPDNAFFKEKIHVAFSKRNQLLKTDTDSYRLLFGENDGFPGLIADVYKDVLVVKFYTGIWFPYIEMILPELVAISKVATVVVRLSRNLQKSALHEFKDGQVIHGTLSSEVIYFKEHGIRFSANVIHGHKTGYFLDHRHNRKRVGEMSKGKKVLDVFSYAGGFSVHALAGGATEVLSLDISAQALEVALENGKLNPSTGQHKIMAIDAFVGLQQLIDDHKKFDIVVIDPPSFAKSAREIESAKHSYNRLAVLGTQLVAKNGILVLASCSSRITAQQFFDISEQAIVKSKRSYKVIEKTFHDSDHPIGFPEGAYLKCGYYRLES
ncbi:rRNA (guanine-N2)-methyltransferase [Dokdonia pacifica]|uniref:23S rRNA (Cytosine1962-C5)-methyltransferase n=1 Tax=Dokdonia pacifica TaxID=1627892 RepID=A0A239DB09_9FLAO|nr:class I SAM-dependent rRNA methyltransferase [Dokdonia pacifica]GGG40214.1 rRNA (guanine-N2)-methyltransferase [Dokdonia pacifica]SNS29238.1 23S rRNA (cytosine1962-C5)-methyltransferase [Dokdonia pacifica]